MQTIEEKFYEAIYNQYTIADPTMDVEGAAKECAAIHDTETAALRAEIGRLEGEPVRFAEWYGRGLREWCAGNQPHWGDCSAGYIHELYALFTAENAWK